MLETLLQYEYHIQKVLNFTHFTYLVSSLVSQVIILAVLITQYTKEYISNGYRIFAYLAVVAQQRVNMLQCSAKATTKRLVNQPQERQSKRTFERGPGTD
jgi:hypothetical protein